MDMENQRRVKEYAEKFGKENVVCILGGAEAEASGLAAETVSNGDPAWAGPLAGVQLGLKAFHIFEDEIKNQVDPAVYEAQVSLMEMVLDVDAITKEVSTIRNQYANW
ncbi:MAG: glycine reductase complex selenoprotein [Symbiobacteriaceae bacterium]|jgi:betaine reductase|nr:glycine reductase complex selenoprotein [Symbiobacteriaceae bacterium]